MNIEIKTGAPMGTENQKRNGKRILNPKSKT